jgi:hypothetical protein
MREIRNSADVPAHTDSPPALRFELTSQEDRILSEQTKRPEFMNVIKVFMRAPGDMKTEVPDIAEMTAYDAYEKDVDVEREVPKFVENRETGKIEESLQKMSFREKMTFHKSKIVHPWIEKLKFQLDSKQITERYYRACLDSFENFKNKQNLPKDGYPLINWKGIDPAMRDKLLGMGINTVELVAGMTEEAMTYVGMGSRSIKTKAEAFLLQNNAPEQAAIEMTQMKQQNEALAEQLSALASKLAELGERQQEKSLVDVLRARYAEISGSPADMRWGTKKLAEEIEAAEKEARQAA